jgi:SAM-dependent methyltransferase
VDCELNLGCGKDIIPGMVNVDVFPYPGIGQVVDLSIYPWPWENESVNGIYCSHMIEHIFDQKKVLEECYRILKKGGYLHIKVPHVTAVTSMGNLGHYRGYCYDTFKDYLSKDYYLFGNKKFETTYQKINWWRMNTVTHNVPLYLRIFVYPLSLIIDSLIALSPRIFENSWCYWVGGAREVEWKGVKV